MILPLPEPAQLSREIAVEVRVLLGAAGPYLAWEDPRIVELWEKCDKLQAVNVVSASVSKADVAMLTGDLAEVERWLRNAEANNRALDVRPNLGTILANLGYFRRAFDLYQDVLTHVSDESCVRGALVSGAFRKLSTCYRNMPLQAMDASPDLRWDGELATKVSERLDALGASEQVVVAAMDEAGRIMRREKMMWLEPRPDIKVSSRSVLIDYRLAVSSERAAQLSWELADAITSPGSPGLPEGVYIGFVGVGAGE
jgi:hypothetical protein